MWNGKKKHDIWDWPDLAVIGENSSALCSSDLLLDCLSFFPRVLAVALSTLHDSVNNTMCIYSLISKDEIPTLSDFAKTLTRTKKKNSVGLWNIPSQPLTIGLDFSGNQRLTGHTSECNGLKAVHLTPSKANPIDLIPVSYPLLVVGLNYVNEASSGQ